jgi:hypothetical protein
VDATGRQVGFRKRIGDAISRSSDASGQNSRIADRLLDGIDPKICRKATDRDRT